MRCCWRVKAVKRKAGQVEGVCPLWELPSFILNIQEGRRLKRSKEKRVKTAEGKERVLKK